MTRYGVLSDTHMMAPDDEWLEAVNRAFKGLDAILHAGDITNLSVLDALAPTRVLAVAGNMDSGAAAMTLPVSRIIEAEGKKIGLIHGWGAKEGLEDKVRSHFDRVDCIVFGHSHRPTNYKKGGVLFFNPGSARPGGGAPTAGILTVDKEISGSIIEL